MIAVESNVLVYAHRGDSAFHEVVRPQIGALASDEGTWAIPWPCIHEFYSTVTHPRRYRPPSTPEQALDQIGAWIEGGAVLIGEAGDHLDRLRRLISEGRVVGGMVRDAKIAAICLSHGVGELWTADRDFSRFPALKTRNPLVATA